MKYKLVRTAFVCALLALAGMSLAQKKPVAPSADWLRGVPTGRTRVLDLSYAISDKMPAWPGDEHPFTAEVVGTPEKDGYFSRKFCMLEHYGTHLDAPRHFPPGALYVNEIPPERLFGPAVVIDVSEAAAKDPDYRLAPADVAGWEESHGHIPAGAIVILRTGWSSRWPDQARYRNMDAKGVMHFPGYSVEAATILLSRHVVALGIDTLSIDYGASQTFEVHRLALPAGLYQLENLSDLTDLPETGAFLIVAPIKLEGGSGGPCRVFALLPQ